MLQYKEDWRTVAYLVVTSGLLVLQWNLDEFNVLLWIASLLMAISCSVIAHNHNHLRIWKNGKLNALTDYWITVHYGFPVFAWIPTHNKNHHKFNNREGDYTITWRYSEKNNLGTLVTYPTISSYFQQKPIRDYLSTMWRKRKSRFWYSISQYVVLALFIGVALWIDWQKALLYVIIPQQVALFSVLVFNYLQHVHADEESEYNHSRNIVGPVMNLFLFNNGYHTVHHDHPGLHWSKTPAKHKEIEHLIDPSLNEPSILWLILRVYLLGPLFPSLKTKSMRLERMKREESVDGDVAAEAATS